MLDTSYGVGGSGNRSRLIARFAGRAGLSGWGVFPVNREGRPTRSLGHGRQRRSPPAESFFDISFPIVRSHATLSIFDNKAPCRPGLMEAITG